MSTFAPATLHCPHCGHARDAEIARSVHAGRAPQHRAAILDGSFQRFRCRRCAGKFEIDAAFIYIDPDRREWIGVFPSAEEHDWQALEEAPAHAHARACGPEAPPLARELGADMRIRTVFGLAALREKLVCFAAGLDDVALELVKLRRLADGPAIAEQASLRLLAADDDELLFAASGEAGEATTMSLERRRFEALAADIDRGERLARELSAGPFVDLRRLFV